MFIRHESGQLDSILVYDAKIFAEKDFKELYLTRVDEETNVLYGGAALGIIALLSAIFLYRRSQKNKINKIDELSALEIVLIGKIGMAITREDLDELLQITHLSFESIKVKRSQMITALNKRKKVVISRDRDPKDRRMFLYHISPFK